MPHTVLIVEDAVEDIDTLKCILRDEYTIEVALNGNDALSVAEKTKPDIILLEIMLPDLDGYEVCVKLKANPLTCNVPVIFVTAKDQDLDEIKGFESGAVDYIRKPVNPLIIKARIMAQLAIKDHNAELENQVNEKTKEIIETRKEIIERLSRAGEFNDGDTYHHLNRVTKYAYSIAKAYGLDEKSAQLLSSSAPMHDIGKIGISDEIIHKPGVLLSKEIDTIREHCEIGAQIIGDNNSELLKAARIVALQHHEKWDGTGYPRGLSGSDIHIFARITSVSDVFDALISERSYKKAWSVEHAVKHIKSKSGIYFDPEVVIAFLKALPEILIIKENFRD